MFINRSYKFRRSHPLRHSTPKNIVRRPASNTAHSSDHAVKELKNENHQLLQRCKSVCSENRNLKDLSYYWSQRAKESDQYQLKIEKERREMIEKCEKLKKERLHIENELKKSDQMLLESNK